MLIAMQFFRRNEDKIISILGGLFCHLFVIFVNKTMQVKLNHFTNSIDATFSFHPILSIGFQSPRNHWIQEKHIDGFLQGIDSGKIPPQFSSPKTSYSKYPNLDLLQVVG